MAYLLCQRHSPRSTEMPEPVSSAALAFTHPIQRETSAGTKPVRNAEPILDDQPVVHVFRPNGVTIGLKSVSAR